jgi:hypothetical protein
MLLRRFSDHVKSQNWFAVTLDVVVVVVGIFLAFQVERWYEERRLISEEESHLVALAVDFAAAREDVNWMINRWRLAREAGQTLLNLDATTGSTISNGEFYDLVANVQRNGNLEPKRQTYDTLVATGKIEAIRDVELKTKLGEYYSGLDRILESRSRWDSEMAMVWEPYLSKNLDRVKLVKSAHPDDTGHLVPTHAPDRYLQIIGSDEFEGVIAKRWHFYRDRGNTYQELLESTMQMENLIKESLQRFRKLDR